MSPSTTGAARSRNPRGQGERLREALLDAAIELLADLQDVQALSIRAVTARAGVTPTALYLHFDDKEALIAAVKERCFAELRRYLAEGAAGHDDDPRARLQAMGVAYLRFARERRGYYRVIFHTPHDGANSMPFDGPQTPDKTSTAREALNDLIGGVARCLPGETPVQPVAMMIWSGLHGYTGLTRAMPHFPFQTPDEYVHDLLDAHLRRSAGVPA